MKKEEYLSYIVDKTKGMGDLEISKWDITDDLQSEAQIEEYLNAVFADGDHEEIARALGHVARAYGMGKIATKSGSSRTSLYKTLNGSTKPKFDTVVKILNSLGYRLTLVPIGNETKVENIDEDNLTEVSVNRELQYS